MQSLKPVPYKRKQANRYSEAKTWNIVKTLGKTVAKAKTSNCTSK